MRFEGHRAHHPRPTLSTKGLQSYWRTRSGPSVSVASRLRQVSGAAGTAGRGTARQEALFDKKLAQEETWIRQGIKARRTRNEGRVRALKAMREERAQRRVAQGKGSFFSRRLTALGDALLKREASRSATPMNRWSTTSPRSFNEATV